jgi:drug/metabolite transporter (DMT)-like permease
MMTGSLFALCSAFFWAVAVILFKKSGEVFSPISLNIYKCIVAFVLILLTMLVLNQPVFPDKPLNDWILLSVSGVLGITMADLLFFTALGRLGAGLVAIAECMYLPFVILFSYIILGEKLTIQGIFGGILVLSAIAVGSVSKKNLVEDINDSVKILPGMLLACLSMVFLALGIVMIKELLETTDILWATLVRITAGLISLSVILILHPKRRQYLSELRFSGSWLVAFPASVAGNYLALICWMAGMKYTTASRAAILNQMATIFIFILAAIFLKEKMTRNKIIAIGLAVSGAWLTLY